MLDKVGWNMMCCYLLIDRCKDVSVIREVVSTSSHKPVYSF